MYVGAYGGQLMSEQRQTLLDHNIDEVLVERLIEKSEENHSLSKKKKYCQSSIENNITIANKAVKLWLFADKVKQS